MIRKKMERRKTRLGENSGVGGEEVVRKGGLEEEK